MVDSLANLAKFFHRGVFQTLSLAVEMFVDFQGRFLKEVVGFWGPTGQYEILSTRDSCLSVTAIEGESEQSGGAFRSGKIGAHHETRWLSNRKASIS